MSSGKHAHSRKLVKGGTTSSRKHRFESFNQRIAKLNIDPIRRRQRNQVQDDDLTESASFFNLSLDRWRELNLSENFTSFVREVEPMCNSLPQILHYHQRIFDILVSYIGKRDSLCLEPLLDLLSNFAHDLGVRFEDHFPKSVVLLASLAATHTDVESIEWSFTCLAWLFKYLSRLLVPNLVPLFELMAPLLGKEQQKIHTTRFAAEAMSFLIRKAAALYPKDPKPLSLVMKAMCNDVSQVAGSHEKQDHFRLYQQGLMTLLTNSIKGIDRKVHSAGPHVYRCMVDSLFASNRDGHIAFKEIVRGVTVSLIHQTDSATFQPMLDIVLEQVGALDTRSSIGSVASGGHLLFIICTVRKGSRIQDWTPLLNAVISLLQLCDGSCSDVVTEVFKAAAVVFQYSPLEAVLPKVRTAMEMIASVRFASHFIPFCTYFHDLGSERFQDFLGPYFSKFIASRWENNELQLCLAVPKVGGSASINITCPASWQENMVKTFEDAIDHEDLIVKCYGYLSVLDFMQVDSGTKDKIMEILSRMIHQAVVSPSSGTLRNTFGLGTVLKTYLQYSPAHADHLSQSWRMICGQAAHYGSLLPFLESILLLVGASGPDGGDCEVLVFSLVENLHSDSNRLRYVSLQILDALYVSKHGKRAEIIVTALAIENSPRDLPSARFISMLVRKLSSQYEAASSNKWLEKAIPHFCFGMLTYKLSSVWDDSTTALKHICETKGGEEAVSELAFRWLEGSEPVIEREKSYDPNPTGLGPLTDFQCSNLNQVEQLIEHDSTEVAFAAENLRHQFNRSHTHLWQQVINVPALALRVLLAIPHVAEKRSKRLVPMFLSWAADEVTQDTDSPAAGTQASVPAGESASHAKFTRKDQKAMLDLFGRFSNPRVLYQSSDVFKALQGLLTHGDVEVQSSALKALFSWKAEGVRPYEENLLNLIDDARFRDEISTFVRVDDQNSVIQEDHRPAIMPILLRLLYGKMIAGLGPKSESKGQSVRRKTILGAISRLDVECLRDFIEVALGPLSDIKPVEDAQANEEVLGTQYMSPRKQLGLVKMMKEMLEILGDRLEPFAEGLTRALLYCLIRATRQLAVQQNALAEGSSQVSLLRTVRQIGLQCLNLLSRCCPADMLGSYLSTIFAELLSPRLDKLPIETAQSVSGTLHLFSTWASSQETVLILVEYDARTVKTLIDCLDVPSAKDEVRLFIINDILKIIATFARPSTVGELNTENHLGSKSEVVTQKVIRPNADNLLDRLGSLLRRSPSKEVMGAAIQLVALVAPLMEGSSQVDGLLEICAFLLDQPAHRVNPKCKGQLLQIIEHFVPLLGSRLSLSLKEGIFRTISSLFGYFRDRTNRLILSQVMSVLAEQDVELHDAAKLCMSLNAYSVSKIDEPDFDERVRAFNFINHAKFQDFSPKQWRPILYNMLYHVNDSEELAIRANASFALRRFVEVNKVSAQDSGKDSSDLTKLVLLPALRNGVSNSSELVRTEYLSIIAHLIRHNPQWEEVNDMYVLLANNDEEASFFSNILHIQQHRRLRALRRLAKEAREGGLRSVNVARFFIPLIEHFVFDKAEDADAHSLSAETVITIGALASTLEWPKFRAMFRRFASYIQSRPEVEKTMIKLLGVMIDAMQGAAHAKESTLNVMDESGIDKVELPVFTPAQTALVQTIPYREKLADDLTSNLLPSLISYLHEKDESTVSLRVPVAVSIVKMLKLLPSDRLRDRLPPVLTDVCHILRSRAQESRDLTRRTLVEISILIGPEYFGFILKELRSALARGYQLHVLSFTIHSILVATSSIFKPGDLDYCLPQIVSVIIDDTFGATGQEKDAEEYISKMKEVKSSKSYDSMELVAKTATIESFVHLVRPLQDLLAEKLDLRMVKKIDELLRRISVGLLQNEAVQDRKILVFCHEVMREAYKTGQTPKYGASKEDNLTRRFLINYKGANKTGSRGRTSSYNYKLSRFAFDVLRLVLQKYDSLQTPSNLSGFIPIIGDAIIQQNEEVQASTLRLLTTIIKVPLKAIDENAAIYVAECVKIVKASISTNVELAQAALKLVSAILRERRTVEIRENDLAYLLRRLIPDLEEPDKQGVAFNLLKATMSRKILITEVYEVLDAVAVIMVTNQTRAARDMARGAYFQFIMNYPQSKDRFAKQLSFLVRNLDYKHREGRQSILEAIHLLFAKVGEDLVQDIVGTFFVPLVMVLVNDESNDCREMAGALLKKLLERANVERSQSLLIVIRAWLQSDQPILVRVALQMYGLYLETNGTKGEKEVPLLQSRLVQLLKRNAETTFETDWELSYFALQTVARICQMFPTFTLAANAAPLWASVRQSLFFPHAWVKLSAAKLLGTYFADFARTNANNGAHTLPLEGSGGLWLNQSEIIEVTRASLGSLRVPDVSEELAGQSVRNLVFLGKMMSKTSMFWPQKDRALEPNVVESKQSDDGDTSEEETAVSSAKPALGHLIKYTSALLRRGPLTSRGASLVPLQASLSLLGALSSSNNNDNEIPIENLKPHIPTILLPLHNLTDPAIPAPFSTDASFTVGYKTLVENAQGLMGLLQRRLGTTEYITLLSAVRAEVKERREGRRVKRRIGAVAEPEKAGKIKKRKGERKRERRKEKSGEERGRRRGW